MDAIIIAIFGWLAAWALWGRPRRLELPDPGAAARRRTRTFVIIPARNEAAVLPSLLACLLADHDPGRRTIVVDDHSSDDTAAMARAYVGVEVITAPPLPDGWAGKSWACHVGFQAVADHGLEDDDTLVFVDADVRVAPGAVAAVADEARAHSGLVSVQPFHTTFRIDEQSSLFCGIVAVLGTGAGRRRASPDGAFGPVLATSVGDYRAIGGHEAVRGEIAEDVALGLQYRAAAMPVAIRMGGDLIRFRMYPRSFLQLVEGWTKNMATGAGAVPVVRSLLVAAWITAAGTAFLTLPFIPTNSDVAAGVGYLLYGAFVAQIAWFGRTMGTFGPLTALTYPLWLVVFVGLFVRSSWRLHVRRSVRWRDRTVAVGEARPVA